MVAQKFFDLVLTEIMHGGRCKMFGVLMTFCVLGRADQKILGVLTIPFFLMLRKIGGAAVAPPVPQTLKIAQLIKTNFKMVHYLKAISNLNLGSRSRTHRQQTEKQIQILINDSLRRLN